MLTLLIYEPEAEQPTSREAVEDAGAVVGVVWDGPAGQDYRSGRWHDPVTGATALVDLGTPPLAPVEVGDEDPHQATTYSGWRLVPLTVQIPLAGPHWHAVEALAMVERLLAALPGCMALDVEDTRADDDAEAGPYAWSRPRRIAQWEAQRAALGLELPVLSRGSSLRLWRWRRERAAAAATHGERAWPEITVLHDRADRAAVTACLLPDAVSIALPPVQWVVIRRGADVGCLPWATIAPLAGESLPAGGLALERGAVLDEVLRRAPLEPVTRFQALLDEDWQD